MTEAHIIRRNRFFGLLIIFIIGAPMALAYIMFHTGWGVSGQTVNKGELLDPARSLTELQLSPDNNFFADLYSNPDRKKWRILVPITANCNTACEHSLYISRQVHVRLAEKAYRVERVLLTLDELPTEFQQQLQQEHPNTLSKATSLNEFSGWLSTVNNPADNPEDYFYLVDQQGFAMMRYSLDHTGHDLLDDIKKLLKFTYDK